MGLKSVDSGAADARCVGRRGTSFAAELADTGDMSARASRRRSLVVRSVVGAAATFALAAGALTMYEALAGHALSGGSGTTFSRVQQDGPKDRPTDEPAPAPSESADPSPTAETSPEPSVTPEAEPSPTAEPTAEPSAHPPRSPRSPRRRNRVPRQRRPARRRARPRGHLAELAPESAPSPSICTASNRCRSKETVQILPRWGWPGRPHTLNP